MVNFQLHSPGGGALRRVARPAALPASRPATGPEILLVSESDNEPAEKPRPAVKIALTFCS